MELSEFIDLVSAVAQGGSAIAIVWLTIQMRDIAASNLKVSQEIAWFTGAMESHSDIALKLEAAKVSKETGMELVWWDPSKEAPKSDKRHGAPVELKRIYFYLPLQMREGGARKAPHIAISAALTTRPSHIRAERPRIDGTVTARRQSPSTSRSASCRCCAP